MAQSKEAQEPVKFRLRESLLETNNINFLEEILKASKGFSHVNITQYPPMWIGFVELSDKKEPIGEHLPGGRIIRKRYSILEIKARYDALTKDY